MSEKSDAEDRAEQEQADGTAVAVVIYHVVEERARNVKERSHSSIRSLTKFVCIV